jgi:hypothetical protein
MPGPQEEAQPASLGQVKLPTAPCVDLFRRPATNLGRPPAFDTLYAMGLFTTDLSDGIANCQKLLRDLGSEPSDHDRNMCVAAVRRESKRWRQSELVMEQVRKLVAAGNHERAAKLLEALPTSRFRFF